MMQVLMIVWIVLMLFWLFGGGYSVYTGPTPNHVIFFGNTLIPWICVFIIGLVAFGAVSSTPVVIHQGHGY